MTAAYERAARAGFQLACEAEVGRLLAALAAAVLAGAGFWSRLISQPLLDIVIIEVDEEA